MFNFPWAVQLDIGFSLRADNFTSLSEARRWLISWKLENTRVYRRHNVFWPHGWIKVLGFDIGAGIFIRLSERRDV